MGTLRDRLILCGLVAFCDDDGIETGGRGGVALVQRGYMDLELSVSTLQAGSTPSVTGCDTCAKVGNVRDKRFCIIYPSRSELRVNPTFSQMAIFA